MSRRQYDLAALQAKNLPRATFDLLAAAWNMKVTVKPGEDSEEGAKLSEQLKAAVNAQFEPFVAPQDSCIGCDANLTGLLGSFTWGLVHGEGCCSECGYPARGYHCPPEGAEGLRVERILQYHPDELAQSLRMANSGGEVSEGPVL